MGDEKSYMVERQKIQLQEKKTKGQIMMHITTQKAND
jgi:hypothetical protein